MGGIAYVASSGEFSLLWYRSKFNGLPLVGEDGDLSQAFFDVLDLASHVTLTGVYHIGPAPVTETNGGMDILPALGDPVPDVEFTPTAFVLGNIVFGWGAPYYDGPCGFGGNSEAAPAWEYEHAYLVRYDVSGQTFYGVLRAGYFT